MIDSPIFFVLFKVNMAGYNIIIGFKCKTVIKVNNISKTFEGKIILADISFALGRNQKAALVGLNGVGKSTLLKIIAGSEKADSGAVEITENTKVGYLQQEIIFEEGETIQGYLKKVSGLDKIESRMKEIEVKLSDPKLLEEYGNLQSTFTRMEGYSFDHRAKVILEGFGLKNINSNRSLSELSGGQKSKVALVGILLKGFDVLLLDEPTNNLDLPALIWLEQYINKITASCLIISHDRRFLDNVVSKVFEIDWHSRKINSYTGGYSDYIKYKEKEFLKQVQAYELQQEEIQKLTKATRDYKEWGKKGAKQTTSDHDKFIQGFRREQSSKLAGRAKAIEKRLDQIDKLELPKERPPLVIPLETNDGEAGHIISLDSVIVNYASGFKLGPINLEIPYGDRIGILGSNGSGKSSLLKVLTGYQKTTSGTISLGSSLVIGDLMQEHENLPKGNSLVEFLKKKAKINEEECYRILTKFGFEPAEIRKKIGDLSPGGRARLLLALFSARSVNVLILDEPTNHLDLEAVTALEEMLKTYTGTIIVVSHDRYFLSKARLNRTYIMDEGKLSSVLDYETYASSIVKSTKILLKQF